MKLLVLSPLTERILKGGTIVMIFTLATAPMGYLLRMMLARSLSIEMYGLYFAMVSFFSFFTTYNDIGFGYSLSYFFPKYFRKKDYRTCWNLYTYDLVISVGVSILLSLVLFLAAPWITHNYFKVPEATYLIRVFCLYLFSNSIVTAINRLYNGMQKELYYASMEFVRFLLLIGITFVFYLKNSGDVSVYAWGLTSSYLCIAFLYSALLRGNFAILVRQPLAWNQKLFRQMAAYALPTAVTTSVYTIISFSDTFFLTLFRGVGEVGIYNVMVPIVSVFAIVLSPINYFLFPFISRHIDTDKEKIRTLFTHVLKIIPFTCSYFAIFIILFPNPIISILFGNKWSSTYAAGLSILALGFTITTMTSFFTTFVIGIGKVRERLKVSLIIAVVNILGGISLVPRLGVIGVAISVIITAFVSLVLLGNIIQTELRFHYPISFYAKLIVFGGVLFAVCRWFGLAPSGWGTLILYGLVYTALTGIFGLWINVYPDLRQLLPKKITSDRHTRQ